MLALAVGTQGTRGQRCLQVGRQGSCATRVVSGKAWAMAGQVRGTHLGQAGSEEHTLEELAHALQELVHVRPLEHVHLRARTEGSALLARATAHLAPACLPQGTPVSPHPASE